MSGTEEFDYIVVGSGSGGAVVASRLSEDPEVSVLVLEAGGESRPNPAVQIPAAFAKQFHTDLDWNYNSEPEPHLGGRRIYQPRGRMLGGTSGMNAMIYVRGNRADYDGWVERGADGWSYDDVLPLFRRWEANSRGADDWHGADGPQHVEDAPDPRPISRRMVEALDEEGLERNNDFNGERQEGAGLFQRFTRQGQRWTVYDGYLEPAEDRPNLTVRTGALVQRVVIDDGRATGVEVRTGDGDVSTVRARREVILSAGAFNTPQLLMLSGIGPAEHLAEHGIDVVVDNCHIGAHLMDHPFYNVNWETPDADNLMYAEEPDQVEAFTTSGTGRLSSNVGEVGAFLSSSVADGGPDLEIIGGPVYFWNHAEDVHDSPAYTLSVSLIGSHSEGTVRLASSDPQDAPVICNNYLSDPREVTAIAEGIELVRRAAGQPSLREVTGVELTPGADLQDTESLGEAVRAGVQHTYHPSCTARMSAEGDGVLDEELRVRGVDGLRVVDASAMPRITRGNTHAPVIMIGEKAADLIRRS